MAWKQTRTFIASQMGKTKGWCLNNTRIAFDPDVPAKYPSAWEAEQHTTLHAGTPPAGVAVPVFFSYYATIDGVYKNWGHVGVVDAQGHFWSDGVEYASIAAYNAAGHTPRYVGWGESLNGVQIVEHIADPVPVSSGVVGKHITLPPDSGTWHLYHESGPYSIAAGSWITILHPATSSTGYTYPIVADKGNGIYVIQSPRWGRGALYTNGSKFVIK